MEQKELRRLGRRELLELLLEETERKESLEKELENIKAELAETKEELGKVRENLEAYEEKFKGKDISELDFGSIG